MQYATSTTFTEDPLPNAIAKPLFAARPRPARRSIAAAACRAKQTHRPDH